MRTLPYVDPGQPDLRSAGRLLLWVARHQKLTLVVGVVWGVVWMVAQALIPVAVGQGVQQGVVEHSSDALLRWSAAVLVLALVQAGAGVLRHRTAVSNWLQASFRVAQLIGHHTATTGEALPRAVPTGEVVSTVANDAMRLGGAYDISARFAGSIASYAVIASLLLSISRSLGLLVLLGVPLLTGVLGLLVRPLHRRQAAQREEAGKLTTLGADTVAGLRVLRGIGGEHTFVSRYRDRSERVRLSGVRVAGVQATLDAAQVLLPGVFVVLVTWLGARATIQGHLDIGDLVTFYGLSAFLITPLRTATEAIEKTTRAYVGAKRIVSVLRVQPAITDHATTRRVEPLPDAPLHDPTSGVVIQPGRLTAIVSEHPEESAALADRLGRFVDVPGAPVRLGDERLDLLPLDSVRQHVVVSESDPRLFTGALREQLAGVSGADQHRLDRAVHTADAYDVLDALPDGLDSTVEERGRSFSGGQRQRLSLARALMTEAPVLVLVEPTSAVDAHTEARIAERLTAHRSGRTTVLVTASPLLLDAADHVLYLDAGRLAAEGTHRELLESHPPYRRTVIRGEDL
ncbi:MAG TPA: ABC transporter ATP-binding protein [Actinomycetales bacterium]|nr:ABC transporter ATP-binding protein [Actinomycetales bacterium]